MKKRIALLLILALLLTLTACEKQGTPGSTGDQPEKGRQVRLRRGGRAARRVWSRPRRTLTRLQGWRQHRQLLVSPLCFGKQGL